MNRAWWCGSDGLRTLTFALALSLLVTACGDDPAPAPGASADVRKDAGKSGGKPSGDDSTSRRDAGVKKDASKPLPPSDGEDGSSGGDDAGAKAATADGLPCAVAALLAQRCASCHGATPLFGAPMSLVSYADLQAPAPLHPELKTFEAVLERVHDDASPMPPAPKPRLTAAELATLDAWAKAGAPESAEACGPSVPTGDAGVDSASTVPKPADCEQTYELNAHGGSTPTDHSKFQISPMPALEGNQYHCFYFDPPYDSAAGMLWFQPMLDNTANLHHWILYATNNKTHESGTSAGCNAQQSGSYFVAGWAPGANNSVVPDDVALDLPSGPKAGLILEVHYYNTTGKAQEDASGIRFCTGAKAKRPHLAAVHTLGTEGLCIPAGASKDFGASCAPRTDMGDIHINGIWPHMHKAARRMVVSIKRKSGTTDVIHDAPFDFQSQVFFPMNDVVVHPGDSVLTRCYYENDTSSQIHYGERTQDEMCYAFTMAWPAGALASPPSMLSDPSTALLNRCADSLSILQSCNGIADRPVNAEHP